MNMKIQDSISVLTDPVIRKMYEDDPKAAYEELKSRGHHLPDLTEEQELKVVANTADKMYIVMPAVGRHTIVNEDLARIQGGVKGLGTAASAGSASTLGTANTTLSTGGTASSVSTAGTS